MISSTDLSVVRTVSCTGYGPSDLLDLVDLVDAADFLSIQNRTENYGSKEYGDERRLERQVDNGCRNGDVKNDG